MIALPRRGKREIVQKMALEGKSVTEICADTGLCRSMACKYVKELGNESPKVRDVYVRVGFWDEWERAVYVLLGGRKGAKMDP